MMTMFIRKVQSHCLHRVEERVVEGVTVETAAEEEEEVKAALSHLAQKILRATSLEASAEAKVVREVILERADREGLAALAARDWETLMRTEEQ